MPRTIQKKEISSPTKDLEERPKLRARRRKKRDDEDEVIEKPVEVIVESAKPERRTTRRSIVAAIESKADKENEVVAPKSAKRRTRQATLTSMENQEPSSVETPKKSPKVQKRTSRRTTMSNVSGVFEIEELQDTKILDMQMESPSIVNNSKKEQSQLEPDVMEKTKNTTYSPKSPTFTYQTEFDVTGLKTPKSTKDTSRRTSRIFDESLAVEAEDEDPKNLTFSPKSPKFTPQIIETPDIGQVRRRSRRNTSTPYTSKSGKTMEPETPKSIIKKKLNESIVLSPLNVNTIKGDAIGNFITTRKRRSCSESMDISMSNVKKSRVTFHPNTSIFRINSTICLDDSAGPSNMDENGEDANISINLLNDLHQYPGTEPPKTPKQAPRMPTTCTPGPVGVLNSTFTPEETKLPINLLKSVGSSKKRSPKKFKAKRTPNFASIHKKNAEKMESLAENKERKQERARKLFAWNAPPLGTINQTISEVTHTVKQPPHTANKSMTRFGFNKQAEQNRQKTLKEAAMKKLNTSSKSFRKNNREYVTGVRSNRRFDLMMQTRNINLS